MKMAAGTEGTGDAQSAVQVGAGHTDAASRWQGMRRADIQGEPRLLRKDRRRARAGAGVGDQEREEARGGPQVPLNSDTATRAFR